MALRLRATCSRSVTARSGSGRRRSMDRSTSSGPANGFEELAEHPEEESERKRYYRLTRTGRAVLTDEGERLGRLARLARARARTGEAR